MRIDVAEDKARTLMDDHGLDEWTLGFDRAKARAGYCNGTKRHISLSKILTEGCTEEEVTMTILHEIAHALVGVKHGHDRVWKRKFIELGGNGERTYTASAEVEKLQEELYKYNTVCEHCGSKYHAARRLSSFSERYCNDRACRARNSNRSTRTYLVWFEKTRFGPVRAHD